MYKALDSKTCKDYVKYWSKWGPINLTKFGDYLEDLKIGRKFSSSEYYYAYFWEKKNVIDRSGHEIVG